MDTGDQAALFHFAFPGWRLSGTAILMVACLVGVGWLARRSWLGIALLAGLSVVWLTVDRLWEVMILFNVTSGHGVALADLVGLGGLVASGWFGWRLRQTRSAPVEEMAGRTSSGSG